MHMKILSFVTQFQPNLTNVQMAFITKQATSQGDIRGASLDLLYKGEIASRHDG